MRKIAFFYFLVAFVISSCEKDDICLLPVTPKLMISFYNEKIQDSLKKPTFLSVWADGKDTLSAYKNVSLDSIKIPLDTNNTQTIYHLKTNSADGNLIDNKVDTVTINYTIEDVYVSRSCGFKTIFNDVTISSTAVWIQSFTPATLTTIDHETTAHVKIYH